MDPDGDRPDAPPASGLWVPLDPILALGGSAALSRAASLAAFSGFAGATLSQSVLQALDGTEAEQVFGPLEEADLPLRIDLSSLSGRAVARGLECSPDALCVPLPQVLPGPLGPLLGRLGELDALASSEETALILQLSEDVSPLAAEEIHLWAQGSAAVVALRLVQFREELALLLSGAEGLGLMGPELRFATALRHGMTGFDGWLPLLGPEAARELLDLAHGDLEAALGSERQLERWWEGSFERNTRGKSMEERQQALVADSEWFGGGSAASEQP